MGFRLLALVPAVIHLYCVFTGEHLLVRQVTKAIPILLLAVEAVRKDVMMTLALLLSMAGDLFLLSDSESFFLMGLSSFLFSHIVFVMTYIRDDGLPHWTAAIAPFSIGVAYFSAFLRPALAGREVEFFAVGIYCGVIASMGATSFAGGRPGRIIGSVFFMMSDAVLSYNLFVEKLEHGPFVVMLTYYVAQFLISASSAKKGLTPPTAKKAPKKAAKKKE